MSTPIHNMNHGLHGSAEDRHEATYERCLILAQDEFSFGELDTRIRDKVMQSAIDATSVALSAIFTLDEGAMYRAPFQPAVDDFRNMVEEVIEGRAQELVQEQS